MARHVQQTTLLEDEGTRTDLGSRLDTLVRTLQRTFGPSKSMADVNQARVIPHYFLHRQFLGEQDLLVIFRTKRCRYQCFFCDLPTRSPKDEVDDDEIVQQFEFVLNELRHSIHAFDRVTLSNEGSVLDTSTFGWDALQAIVGASRLIPKVKTIVLETRMEFVNAQILRGLAHSNPLVSFDILTGFETVSPQIRDEVLRKRESLEQFSEGLDRVAAAGASLTAYVLFKPTPWMTDAEAYEEARGSIDFLTAECSSRGIPLTIRLNPMYVASKSGWARWARENPEYAPPRLSDVMALARLKRHEGLRIYVGLSSEDLSEEWGTYRARNDYSKALIREAVRFNLDGQWIAT